jgi:CBS domain-containing protein
MLVRELMHPGLFTCPLQTRLGDVARLLKQHAVHAMIVTDADGRPAGVLSDTDLLAGEWLSTEQASLATMQGITAGELMSSPVATVDADASASDVAERLRRENLSRLVVTEDGHPVGVIAISDLLRDLARPSAGRSTVADVMSWAIVTCLPDTPVTAAARAMQERRSRSVVVVDRGGAPLGVVTGMDLLSVYDRSADELKVAQLMRAPLTIAPDASLREAADEMLRHEVHRLVVVDPGDSARIPLGLVSTSDIVAEMAAPESVWQTG